MNAARKIQTVPGYSLLDHQEHLALTSAQMIRDAPHGMLPRSESSATWQFSLASVAVWVFALALCLSIVRLATLALGVSTNAVVLGFVISLVPAGFATVVAGALAILLRRQKIGEALVRVGGHLMVALLPAAALGTLLIVLGHWITSLLLRVV